METDKQRQSHMAAFAGLDRRSIERPSQQLDDREFDIFAWHPKYRICQRYFVDHAQHTVPVQALAAFLNIQLPFQWPVSSAVRSATTPDPAPTPTSSFASTSAFPSSSSAFRHPTRGNAPLLSIPDAKPSPATDSPPSLIPFLRRLIVTAMDFPGILHGFFGDDWALGIGPLHEQERRNYLFAAKSGGWASVRRDYDMLPAQTVPFLRPLQGVMEVELLAAERAWSEWLAMEDWMLGDRAPEAMNLSTDASPRSGPTRGFA